MHNSITRHSLCHTLCLGRHHGAMDDQSGISRSILRSLEMGWMVQILFTAIGFQINLLTSKHFSARGCLLGRAQNGSFSSSELGTSAMPQGLGPSVRNDELSFVYHLLVFWFSWWDPGVHCDCSVLSFFSGI